jgi:hypothetical protein
MMDYMHTVRRSQAPTNQSATKRSKLAWWSLEHYSHFSSRVSMQRYRISHRGKTQQQELSCTDLGVCVQQLVLNVAAEWAPKLLRRRKESGSNPVPEVSSSLPNRSWKCIVRDSAFHILFSPYSQTDLSMEATGHELLTVSLNNINENFG